MAHKVKIVETVLRDANQSLIATRMPYDKFEPILETMNKAGFYSAEVWGGATFDVCLRFLGEDPWERLRKIREKMPDTKLQMLLRGQNVLGYKHYSDDFVREFVRKSVENGIDIIRIFDALNDLNNLKVAVEETLKAGAIASGAISYTTSPVHTHKKYVEIVKEMKEMGVQTVCIKDMAGIMGPQEAYDLVSALKDADPDMPIDLHTHCTTGLAFMTYLKAVEAGCDIIDTAISPFSGGTSQPATETMVYALRQLGYEVETDDGVLKEMADFFKPMRDEFVADGTLMPKSMATDTQCLTYQVPGGMLSNLLSQLQMMNALDRFDEALIETPRVRKDMGYPPLVTPTSQIIGVQAVTNVLQGEPYKKVSKEVKAYCRGEYGITPAPIDPEVMKKVLGDEKPLEGRYADTLEPAIPAAEKEIKEKGIDARCMEDVLSYIAFPQIAEKFFLDRKAKEDGTYVEPAAPAASAASGAALPTGVRHTRVTVNGKSYDVELEYLADGQTPSASSASSDSAAAAPTGEEVPVKCPMPGVITKICVNAGQSVKKGDLLIVFEAMKMENEIFATQDGTITKLSTSVGASVNSGDVLACIG